MPPATASHITAIRNARTTLEGLVTTLKAQGDREAAEAVRRAVRELDTAARQGLFKSRGVDL